MSLSKLNNTESCTTVLSWRIYVAVTNKKYLGTSCKVPGIFFSDFNQIWGVFDRFS